MVVCFVCDPSKRCARGGLGEHLGRALDSHLASGKGIKLDQSNFKVFKDKRQFKSWYCHLITTVATQDVKEVLDPDYVPSTQEEKNLFHEKQQYMYHVADTIL